MIPFIVGGGVVIGGALIAIFKEKCSICDSYLTLNERCFCCGNEVCGECGTETDSFGRICTDEHGDIHKALDKYKKIKTYSSNFKGKMPKLKLSEEIKTAFYRKKEDAEDALKFLAALKGASTIQNVSFTKETGQEGNFKFSVWSFNGLI